MSPSDGHQNFDQSQITRFLSDIVALIELEAGRCDYIEEQLKIIHTDLDTSINPSD